MSYKSMNIFLNVMMFPIPGSCDFERDLCTYSNARAGDDFDWIRNSGNTSSSNTGPAQDHTQGNTNGNFSSVHLVCLSVSCQVSNMLARKAWWNLKKNC